MAGDEFIDILDAHGHALGYSLPRSQVHREGHWHRTVHTWIFCEGEMLLQQRSLTKDSNPGLWDISSAGHISAGQIPLDAAMREVQEELGIALPSHRFQWLFTQAHERLLNQGTFVDREYHEVFRVKLDSSEKSLLHFDPQELAGLQWWNWQDYVNAHAQGDFSLVNHPVEVPQLDQIIRNSGL